MCWHWWSSTLAIYCWYWHWWSSTLAIYCWYWHWWSSALDIYCWYWYWWSSALAIYCWYWHWWSIVLSVYCNIDIDEIYYSFLFLTLASTKQTATKIRSLFLFTQEYYVVFHHGVYDPQFKFLHATTTSLIYHILMMA